MNDLKFAIRQLSKNPGFTAVVVLTLALGIGANSAIFSLIHGVLLRPLPYPAPERLVTVWESDRRRGLEQDRVSGPNYLDWRAQNTVFADMAVSPGWSGSTEFNLVMSQGTVKVAGTYTSSSLFSTLGVRPLLGRTLLPEEDQREGNRVAVIGYALWQQYFGGDTHVLGKKLAVDTYGRRDYEIVGVMPPKFGLPSRCELWLPLGWMGVSLSERRSAHWHHVVARLKPGVTIAQARAELNVIQRGLAEAHASEGVNPQVSIVPLLDQALGRNLRTSLFLLWCVVGGVLLIACSNVANLMLARGLTRRKEIALRFALGASRGQVIRQFLVESVLLACVGGAAGALLDWWGLEVLVAVNPLPVPRWSEVKLDSVALFFTGTISIMSGIAFGFAPAWQASRTDLNETLKESTPGASAGAGMNRVRRGLVAAEVALSLVLLLGAGLMLRSLWRTLQAERGFNPERLATVELDFSVSGFSTWVRPTATRPQVPLRELMQRLRALPGVEAVAAGSQLLRRDNQPPHEKVAIHGRPAPHPQAAPAAEFKGITPDWVRAMGARILIGRDFTESDTLESPGVALINQTFARRYFQNENPIGRHVKMGLKEEPLGATDPFGLSIWYEIVGVVSDIKSLHPHPESVPEVYRPYWQYPMQNPTLLVRAQGNHSALTAGLGREVKQVLPSLPQPRIRTMREHVGDSVAQPRLQAQLLGLFAALALLLAGVGLYGVLTSIVNQRTREIGIRMALGARAPQVLWLVVRQGMKIAAAGVAIGMLAAVALTRVIRHLLYEITPGDGITFCSAGALLLTITLAACGAPALRATKIDPIDALRNE